MESKTKYFILCFSMLLSFAIYAQPQDSSRNSVRIISLKEVIAALDKNPELLSFDEKIRSTNAYAAGARSLEAPTVTAGLWMFPYRMPATSMGGTPEDKGSLMVGVEQMIMNPAKRKSEQRYMQGMTEVDRTMQAVDRQNMIEEAKKMYYEWMVLKRKLKVLKESESILALMIRSGEIGYAYNQNQLSRVYKAQSELYVLQNMIVMSENDIRMMNVNLNTMMNIDKAIVFDVDTNYTIEGYESTAIDTSRIYHNRSDVRGIEESKKILELKRQLELSKRKPDFGFQYAHMNSFGAMPNQFNVMGMVTIPIAPWSSKGYKSALEGVAFEVKALEQQKAALVNNSIGRIERIKIELANKKRQMNMYDQHIIPSLQKNFNASLTEFEHMKEDMFMTIDAWMALKMARLESLNLLSDVLKLQASYERELEKE